ncbi:transcription termination factor Rho [Nocardioides coralli]|nr:transcription termination factor Rho [Nocardioides coralli]
MRIADLKSLAGSLGISGAGSMKKAELVSAIKAAQSGGQSGGAPAKERDSRDDQRPTDSGKPADEPRSQDQPAHDKGERRDDRRDDRADDRRDDQGKQSRGDREADGSRDGGNDGAKDGGKDTGRDGGKDGGKDKSRNRQDRDRQDRDRNRDQAQGNPGNQNQQNQNRNQGGGRPDDGDGRSSRSRRRRGRDRNRGGGSGGSQRSEPDTTILEDDVLLPAAGILDVLDNYAFVRTSGYLPGSEDVYLSLSMVRKFGLRRGDAIVGQVRQPREGERKEKFNPMVRVDSVNGADPEAARDRVEFSKLTPLYPSDRLRLETEPTNLIGRVIDIAAPIGKGQRGLIVSPAKAGKTMIMQSIANSITTNNPECHLMVVLVDERPEEVTDFERSVKGEVISSTFDRPASDHTTVAELAIERAKRLVELGHDVVVLLDGITRLGRAYNLAAPASGRILSGGVDSAALYPPKRFFGAARNIENGGSLTILATALIESGSKMDEVIFEEFKGTGNMEIRLRRDFADKRLFPAIDAVQSGTRREELLMSKDELAIVWKLRRVLSGLDGQQALELLLERLKKSQSNIEFLMQVQKTTPGAGQND